MRRRGEEARQGVLTSHPRLASSPRLLASSPPRPASSPPRLLAPPPRLLASSPHHPYRTAHPAALRRVRQSRLHRRCHRCFKRRNCGLQGCRIGWTACHYPPCPCQQAYGLAVGLGCLCRFRIPWFGFQGIHLGSHAGNIGWTEPGTSGLDSHGRLLAAAAIYCRDIQDSIKSSPPS